MTRQELIDKIREKENRLSTATLIQAHQLKVELEKLKLLLACIN